MKCDLYSDLPRKIFLTWLFLCSCLAASGCSNTRYVGVWDGSGAAIGVSNNTCLLAKANGAITFASALFPPALPTVILFVHVKLWQTSGVDP